jgi:hypothetical protein
MFEQAMNIIITKKAQELMGEHKIARLIEDIMEDVDFSDDSNSEIIAVENEFTYDEIQLKLEPLGMRMYGWGWPWKLMGERYKGVESLHVKLIN